MSRRKEAKEETPTASLPLKITHVFGSAARRPFQGLIGAALFSKNFPDFINAPELRSEKSCAQQTEVVDPQRAQQCNAKDTDLTGAA